MSFAKDLTFFNPIALRTAKTLWSFSHSECNRVNFISKPFLFIVFEYHDCNELTLLFLFTCCYANLNPYKNTIVYTGMKNLFM